MSRRVTASKVSLARHCLAPWTSHIAWAKTASTQANVGTAFHKWPEIVIAAGGQAPMNPSAYVEQLPDITEDLRPLLLRLILAWEIHWRACRSLVGWSAEVAYAYDPQTGEARELGSGLQRDYSGAKAGEMAMTMDARNMSDGALIIDWKTGKQANAERAKDHGQGKLLALAVARAHGLDAVAFEIVHVATTGITVDRALYDGFALDDYAEELRDIDCRVRAGQQEPNPGTHCHSLWCPIVAGCPAAAPNPWDIRRDTLEVLRTCGPLSLRHIASTLSIREEQLSPILAGLVANHEVGIEKGIVRRVRS